MQNPNSGPPADTTSSVARYLPARFRSIILACLDANLPRSAAFYAERYFALDNKCHDALHLYSTSLLRCGQTQSALWLVSPPYQKDPCPECRVVQADCYTALGQHAQAGAALEASLQESPLSDIGSSLNGPRETRVLQEEAVLYCKVGKAALKANLIDKAVINFKRALAINPLVWDAFEGLCAAGSFPDILDLFPSRNPPVKQGPEDFLANVASSSKQPVHGGGLASTGSGLGFFTPGQEQNGFATPGFHMPPLQPFRLGTMHNPRDSLTSNESSFYPDNSILGPLRAQRTGAAVAPRPLSSADEAGPAPKKPRSHSRQAHAEKEKVKPETRIKKAGSRPVLVSSNPITKPSLPTTTTAASTTTNNNNNNTTRNAPTTRGKQTSTRSGKSENTTMAPPSMASRRSARLLSNHAVGEKQKSHNVKHPPPRKRTVHGRSKSTESEMDEDMPALGDVGHSPQSNNTQSPRSDDPPIPVWTEEMEQAAQDAYYTAVADIYVYDLMRLFASCVRLLAMYDCEGCLSEIDLLPRNHQQTVTVILMIAKARYEQADYIKAERFFDHARSMDPHRVWDMELYSTTLWHLQRNAKLSFLAQELLSIDARCPEAWIAIGNCFSLQKERSQAMTCFRRAAQLDSSCGYAYTLMGHELAEEDIDKAVTCFQSAVRVDPRSYNAWYGLGSCYLRMSKLKMAEYHFRKASSIHPQNAVLLGCVGMAVERRGDSEQAYELFTHAVHLSPDNALVRYRRAKILISSKKYREAIVDLEYLHRKVAPEEANVVFQLARVYRLVGDETKSAQMLAVARDMSPKSMNKIKRLLSTDREEDDEDEDEGMVGGDSMEEG